MKNVMGKPSLYTQAIADEIIDRIASGETLTSICRSDPMPAVRTVYDWMRNNSELSARFARAREQGFDAIAEDALKIADTQVVARTETAKEWGVEVKEEDALGHRRLQVETRLKLLAKWDPKRYGEKLDVTGVPASSVNVLLSTRDKLKRLKRAREESEAPAAIEGEASA